MTRDFKQTILERISCDPEFVEALELELLEADPELASFILLILP